MVLEKVWLMYDIGFFSLISSPELLESTLSFGVSFILILIFVQESHAWCKVL